MATGTAQRGPQATPPARKSEGRWLEYDQFIDTQLRKARGQVKGVELAGALMTLVAGGLLYFLAVSLVDHWMFTGGLGIGGRLFFFALFIISAGWYIGRRLAPLVIMRINPIYAAETIEKSKPSLKNSLINFLFLRSERSGVPQVIYQAVEEQAASNLQRTPVDATVDRTKLIQIGYVLLAAVALFAAYKLFSPKDPIETVGRIVMPWADIQAPTRVTILDVQPGSRVAYLGEAVEISAELRGIGSDEPVRILYTTGDRQTVDQAVTMYRAPDAFRHTGKIPAGESGLQQDIEYRIEAGDAVSPTYMLQAAAAPTIAVESIDYEFPAYTGKGKSRVENAGDIQAIEGTRVTIHGRANQPLKSAQLVLDGQGRHLEPAMKIEGRSVTATIVLALDEKDRAAPQFSRYQLRPNGRLKPEPAQYKIDVFPDLAPEISFLAPENDEVAVPVNGSLPLEVRAVDPDFALSEVTLSAEVGEKSLIETKLLSANFSGPFQKKFLFEPAKLGLKEGDSVNYWATAKDNRTPEANEAHTKHRQIRIVKAELRRPSAERSPKEPNKNPPEPNANPQDQPQDQQPDHNPKEPNKDQANGDNNQNNPDRNQKKPEDGGNRDNPNQQNQDKPSENGDRQPQDKKPGDNKQGDKKQQDKQPNGDSGKPEKQKSGSKDESKSSDGSGNEQKQESGDKGSEGAEKKTSSGNSGGKSSNGDQTKDGSQSGQSSGDHNDGNGAQGQPQPNSGQSGRPSGDRNDGNGAQGQSQPQPNSGQSGNPESGPAGGNDQSPPSDTAQDVKTLKDALDKQAQNGAGRSGQSADKQPGAQGAPGSSQDKKSGGDHAADGSSPNPSTDPRGSGGPFPNGKPGTGSKENNKPAGDQSGHQPGDSKPQPGDKADGQRNPGDHQNGDKASGDKNAADKPDGGEKPAGEKPNGEKPNGQQSPMGDKSHGENSQAAGQPKPGDKASGNPQPGDKSKSGDTSQSGQKTEQGKKPNTDKNGTPDGSKNEAGDKTLPDKKNSNAEKGENKPGVNDPSKEGQGAQAKQGSQPSDKKTEQPDGSTKQNPDAKGGDPQSPKGSPSAGQKSTDDKGSPSPQEGSKPNEQKTDAPGSPKESDSPDNAKSPSNSPKESNSQGSQEGDRSGNGGKGGGQTSKNPGTGGAGSSTAADEGKGTSKGAGKGEDSSKPGTDKQSEKSTGQAGDKKGTGSTSSDKPADQGKPSNQPGSDKPGGGGADSGFGGNRTGPLPDGARPDASPINGDEANKEFAQKQFDLALDKLKKGNPDLLKELNWSADDARKLAERLEQMKAAAKKDPQGDAAKKMDDLVRSLGSRAAQLTRRGDGASDKQHGLLESNDSGPPADYLDQFEAFQQGTLRGGK